MSLHKYWEKVEQNINFLLEIFEEAKAPLPPLTSRHCFVNQPWRCTLYCFREGPYSSNPAFLSNSERWVNRWACVVRLSGFVVASTCAVCSILDYLLINHKLPVL